MRCNVEGAGYKYNMHPTIHGMLGVANLRAERIVEEDGIWRKRVAESRLKLLQLLYVS